MPGDVSEVETALEEALRDRSMRVARGPSRAERRGGGRVVLLVGIQHPLRVLARLTRAYGAGDLDPVTAGPGDLERRQYAVGRLEASRAGDLELRQRCAVGTVEHHVHRPAAAALRDEVLLAWREYLSLQLPRLERHEENPEFSRVDAHGLAHGRELELGLHHPRMVEGDVPAHEIAR